MAVWDIKERNNIVRANDIRGNVGLFAAGNNGSLITTIEDINLTTAGNATTFGNLISARGAPAGMGSAIRGFFSGGETPSANVDVIEYIAFSTGGNTSDFGNLLGATRGQGTASNNTRGMMAGGTPANNVVEFITMASIGNAIDFGNLTNAGVILNGGLADTTRACFAGVNQNPGTNYNTYIDFFTISTTGNAADFGDLTVARYNCPGVSSSTRGVWQGGRKSPGANSNDVDYITISSTGNAADFGDLTVARYSMGGASNSVRGTAAGGASPAQNTIDFIQIATTANSTDFGDLGSVREGGTGCANGHGGISLDTFGSQRPSATYMPGSGRGIAMGGYAAPAPKTTIELIHIPTLGNSSDFGDMHTGIAFGSANSSLTRTIMQGGYNDDLTTEVDQIQYIEHASQGNGADFGNLLSTRANSTSTGSCSSTRGLSEAGGTGGGSVVNEIEYITMATIGNAQDFGNLTVARELCASCSNGTRGVTGGGGEPGVSNVMDYLTIASTGNSADFGNLTVGRDRTGSLSSTTRGCFSGGRAPSNSDVIDYITITSTGNAQDFGNLSAAKSGPNGMSNSIRGLFLGGRISPANINVIDHITIASTGNAADFGDLSEVKEGVMCGSDSHGGLQG